MVSCSSLLWANGFVAGVTAGVKSILAAGSRVPMERCVGCMYSTLLSRVCVYLMLLLQQISSHAYAWLLDTCAGKGDTPTYTSLTA